MAGREERVAPGGDEVAAFEDRELATRQLRRRLAEAHEEIEAAEPGTDDFLRAYRESARLEALYREVRTSDDLPSGVWTEIDGFEPRGGGEL